MEDIDTFARPEKCVNLHIGNYLPRKENAKVVKQLNSEEFIIRAEDLSKDVERGTSKIKLSVNINDADQLINGSIGTIEYIHFNNPNKPLLGEIMLNYVKATFSS